MSMCLHVACCEIGVRWWSEKEEVMPITGADTVIGRRILPLPITTTQRARPSTLT